MTNGTRNPLKSLEVTRIIQRYQRDLGALVMDFLEESVAESQKEDITWVDIQLALGKAMEVLKGAKDEADEATLRRSMADIEAGRTRPLQELIDALPCGDN